MDFYVEMIGKENMPSLCLQRLSSQAHTGQNCRPRQRHLGEAGHDCNGRYRRHRRIQSTMLLEAGPDSEARLGNHFADVKACKHRKKIVD